ncbi:MAG: hypothetical protein M3018_14550 [Actinomycetota bacterium]|nr:hypothetical protein [Actinomycetota bacterium]
MTGPESSGPRAPELPLPSPGAVSSTPRLIAGSIAPAPYYEAAAVALRRLAAGASVADVAMEPGFEELAAALRDLAARPQTPERLAAILKMLAAGESVAQIAIELGCEEAKIAAELEPSHTLAAALAAALLARSAVPLQLGTGGQGNLRTMPVRFPEAQYQRLKEWSTEHNFPMAVVVRGLVERFLDGQQRSAA